MYIVNARDDDIYLLNITPFNLKNVYEWYNDEEFKYATGMDGKMSLKQLAQKYIEVKKSEEHFWVGIFISSNEMIGVLKGQIKYGPKVSVWINTLIIDKAFQNKGYGAKAIKLFLSYTKKKSNISVVYIAVSDRNEGGCKFWGKLGFENYSSIKDCINFSGEISNAIIMYKLV